MDTPTLEELNQQLATATEHYHVAIRTRDHYDAGGTAYRTLESAQNSARLCASRGHSHDGRPSMYPCLDPTCARVVRCERDCLHH